jgi:hypothetical protein
LVGSAIEHLAVGLDIGRYHLRRTPLLASVPMARSVGAVSRLGADLANVASFSPFAYYLVA